MQYADNEIHVESPIVEQKTIFCKFEVTGPWKEIFKRNSMEIKYSVDVSDVPVSIAIVPVLANILPIAWIYNAKIIVPTCDADFYNCMSEVKHGYETMYPNLKFDGCIEVAEIENNVKESQGAICFFSGGVDAFDTLIRHVNEEPILLTLFGADISLDDVVGQNRVEEHVKEVSKTFNVKTISAKSAFRSFITESVLDKKVAQSGDGWWHGFQHGLGILGHAAPISWKFGKSTVYIASSFTAADKGKVTCASDPTIDNHVRFCSAHIVHDGYEFQRQDKVANLVMFSHNTGIPVNLRVCWESKGGSNCCKCEKCFRTIFAIYAEGADPREFGFNFDDINTVGRNFRYRFSFLGSDERLLQRYVPIQKSMRKNLNEQDIAKDLLWFYNGDLIKLVHASLFERIFVKIARKILSIFL